MYAYGEPSGMQADFLTLLRLKQNMEVNDYHGNAHRG